MRHDVSVRRFTFIFLMELRKRWVKLRGRRTDIGSPPHPQLKKLVNRVHQIFRGLRMMLLRTTSRTLGPRPSAALPKLSFLRFPTPPVSPGPAWRCYSRCFPAPTNPMEHLVMIIESSPTNLARKKEKTRGRGRTAEGGKAHKRV